MHQHRQRDNECPVRSLGTCEDWYFFIDALGQYRAIRANQFSRSTVYGLFGGQPDYLRSHWPDSTGLSWNYEQAAEALISEAIRTGIVDPASLGFPVTAGQLSTTDDGSNRNA